MSDDDGRILSDDELADLHVYHRMGIAPPERYAGVLLDNTGGALVWRYPTRAERAAAAATAETQAKALADEAAARKRVEAEIAARRMPPPPPEPPAPARRGKE